MPFPDFQPSTRVAFTGGTMTFRHAPVVETAYVYMTGQFYGGRSQFVDGRPFLFAFGDAAGRTRITAVAVPGTPAYDTARRWLSTPPTGPLTLVGLRIAPPARAVCAGRRADRGLPLSGVPDPAGHGEGRRGAGADHTVRAGAGRRPAAATAPPRGRSAPRSRARNRRGPRAGPRNARQHGRGPCGRRRSLAPSGPRAGPSPRARGAALADHLVARTTEPRRPWPWRHPNHAPRRPTGKGACGHAG